MDHPEMEAGNFPEMPRIIAMFKAIGRTDRRNRSRSPRPAMATLAMNSVQSTATQRLPVSATRPGTTMSHRIVDVLFTAIGAQRDRFRVSQHTAIDDDSRHTPV